MWNYKLKITNLKLSPAFTIVELLVAMALVVILVALSSLIFATGVKAHRIADSTIEMTRRADAVCQQLTADFRGLRKDGEILLVWVASPAIDETGNPIVPVQYQKFDRIIFFADGNFQSYNPQPTKHITGNLARISYVPAKNSVGNRAQQQTDRAGRILARTQHIYTADTDVIPFPDFSAAWDPALFETRNFSSEYQTMTMAEWTDLSHPSNPNVDAKNNILTILSDIQNILAVDNSVTTGGPTVDKGDTSTLHNYFAEGMGQFGIQIWRQDEQRWFPQIDPNHDGDYSDSDYPLQGGVIHSEQVDGILYDGSGEESLATASGIPLTFTALKFTFTLYDDKGLFPEGRIFTHIVRIDD